jgi:hypothetical protein
MMSIGENPDATKVLRYTTAGQVEGRKGEWEFSTGACRYMVYTK